MTYKMYNTTEEMKRDMIKAYEQERMVIQHGDIMTESEKKRDKWLSDEIA